MMFLDPSRPFLTLGETVLTLGDALVIAFALLLLVALGLLIGLWRGARRRAAEERYRQQIAENREREAQLRMAEMMEAQSKLAGRLAAMQESATSQQAALTTHLEERLNSVTGRVSQSLNDSARNTHETLTSLQERLTVIDTAQTNIQSLAQNVVGLQAILQNKQTRGAFGQSRMEAIVQDGLPMGAYEFQATLSNDKRPDCLIAMPNDQPGLVIDAKFPLEAWSALKDAETPEETKRAAQNFKRDLEVHIRDIAEKYFIAGETQDTAFLFVPSESIFAEIHENFEAIVQKAHRSRIVIVSPSLLLLSVQVIQAVLKDARMREQAHLIQAEIAKFSDDLTRLDKRVGNLQKHFALTGKDIEEILTSTGKLKRHGERIEEMDFSRPAAEIAALEETAKATSGKTKPFLRAIESGE